MITCPKCGFEQEEGTECLRCGIVFAKYRGGARPLLRAEGPGVPLPAASVLTPRRGPSPWNALLRITLLLALGLFGVSYLLKDRLPDTGEILREMYRSPVQEPTDEPPFQVDAGGVVYTVVPLYAYELYGMVVSCHNCGTWWDVYHHDRWKDFINVKDLCVIWGINISTEAYKDMRFESDSWTCTYYWPNEAVGARFKHTCISNNHLLSHDPEITRALLETSPGDQVHLKGYLVEYSHGSGTFYRKSSTTRRDRGDGACEVVYLEAYEILKEANPLWRTAYRASKYVILITLLLLVVRFIRAPVHA